LVARANTEILHNGHGRVRILHPSDQDPSPGTPRFSLQLANNRSATSPISLVQSSNQQPISALEAAARQFPSCYIIGNFKQGRRFLTVASTETQHIREKVTRELRTWEAI
jgi:hypothetical protein